MWLICSIIFTDRKANSATKMTMHNIPHWIWVRFLSIISGHLRTLSASEKRRYICNVFSHWLTALIWPKNSHNSHPSIFFSADPHSGIQSLMDSILGPQNPCNLTSPQNSYMHPNVIKPLETAWTPWRHRHCNPALLWLSHRIKI